MKKAIVGIVALVVLVAIGLVAVPIVSVSTWKTDTTVELTDMFAKTSENSEATFAFLGNTQPSDADIQAEIERVEQSRSEVQTTAKEIDDLGPNTVDVTGQYADAVELKNSLVDSLDTIQTIYAEQVRVLNDQQTNGTTVQSATEYAELSDDLANEYARLNDLVAQL